MPKRKLQINKEYIHVDYRDNPTSLDKSCQCQGKKNTIGTNKWGKIICSDLSVINNSKSNINEKFCGKICLKDELFSFSPTLLITIHSFILENVRFRGRGRCTMCQ